jgi:NMD protein affecting ribosome stability and mRNA decay
MERTHTLEPMPATKQAHEHDAVTVVTLTQRAGVPYEVARTTCRRCRRILAERPLRRAAA